ncbi:MAG: hypothetical protein U0V48_18765 [Anaerolineales bacterium]
MEISYRSLIEYNALRKLRITEDKVIETFSNPFSRIEYEYSYKDLNENVVRARIGDDRWNSVGFSLLGIPFLVYLLSILFFPSYSRAPWLTVVYGIFCVCSLIAFLMRLYKEEWIWFHNKNNNQVFFAIKITSENREEAEKFILYIREKIKENQ